MAVPRPPLGLAVEITTASGTRFQWGKGSNVPGDVPQGLRFATRLGDGFADANVTLSRRIDRDYPDINLFDDVLFYGQDGTTAYEGRVASNPRSIGDTHSMTVNTAGWMAHTRDRKMTEIYADRDLSRWTDMSLSRRTTLQTASYALGSMEQNSDVAGFAGVTTLVPDTWTRIPIAEAWYDAGPGLSIGKVEATWKRRHADLDSTNVNWSWLGYFSVDDQGLTISSTGNQRAAGPGAITPVAAAGSTWRYFALQLAFAVTPGGSADAVYGIDWYKVAVYGHSGVPQYTGDPTEPSGVYASDVIRDIISRFCPKLNTAGVQNTTYVIPHLIFAEPTDPFDAIAACNAFHRWQFYVWENKTFTYAPVDLTDYDWAVDYFDAGVTLDLQGDSIDDGAFNGICVNFTDVQTGKSARITPDTDSTLADTDPENPANRKGIKHWDELSLSSPNTPEGAAQIGRAALAEKNSPKGEGSITIKGHIKDRAGHWQQGWKVRAGDRVAITSSTSLSDRPRLISETEWDQESLTLTIHVESPPARIDAVLDRLQTALSAAGLS